MNLRKITSLTALTTFILLLLTSVVLYIVPKGRVAYWSDWRLLGLGKEQWSDLHLNLGVAFLLACLLHLYYNWRPLISYLKNRIGQPRFFTGDSVVALLVALVFSLGTLLAVPPFSTIVEISEGFKDRATLRYGEPPYGHAELSTLRDFTRRMKIDLDRSLAALQAADIKVESPEQTMREISRTNRLSPREIHLIMQEASPQSSNES